MESLFVLSFNSLSKKANRSLKQLLVCKITRKG